MIVTIMPVSLIDIIVRMIGNTVRVVRVIVRCSGKRHGTRTRGGDHPSELGDQEQSDQQTANAGIVRNDFTNASNTLRRSAITNYASITIGRQHTNYVTHRQAQYSQYPLVSTVPAADQYAPAPWARRAFSSYFRMDGLQRIDVHQRKAFRVVEHVLN